jgi:intracellular multiplication protein IcmO
MGLNTKKYGVKHSYLLRDTRSFYVRLSDSLEDPSNAVAIFVMIAIVIWTAGITAWADLIMFMAAMFFWWLYRRPHTVSFRMPRNSPYKDKKNGGKSEGIMYMGNEKDGGKEVWFTKNDASTHIMYLGTTGSGKTEGLKSIASNALTWGSGFVYIDGKADTDLWSSLSSMVRRFGRDDDLFVINYMTGNSDTKAPSNTMNPFSNGSASYLTQMLVSLLPDASGDNVMWKERAVSMLGSVMPALTWKRDHQDMPLSVSTIRQSLILNGIIKLSRDDQIPIELRNAIRGYLDTLPGYVDAAFDDNGQVKPAGPDSPNVDTTTSFTQHGYLAMQMTRALQSLGDDYGYIFDSQAADVDMLDVVLNRRILVVLIPALEKSADETANLGKIVAATLKGMMGGTLGSTVEGESAKVIENKPTNSATPFMTIFDEVGYYTTQGMAVMAAQARSLGFSLVFAAQDLPALEKRVKEEARSIVANCNIKIFGKLEDPTQTKELFDKTVGSSFVTEVSSFNTTLGSYSKNYYDSASANVTTRAHSSYEEVRGFKQGEAVVCFADTTSGINVYYSNPGHAKAMRVTRFMALPPPSDTLLRHVGDITKLRDLMVKKGWSAAKADVDSPVPEELLGAVSAFKDAMNYYRDPVDAAMMAVAGSYAAVNNVDLAATPIVMTPESVVAPAAVTRTTPQQPTAAGAAGGPMSGFASPKGAPVRGGGNVVPIGVAAARRAQAMQPPAPLADDVRVILENAAREARDMLVLSDAAE